MLSNPLQGVSEEQKRRFQEEVLYCNFLVIAYIPFLYIAAVDTTLQSATPRLESSKHPLIPHNHPPTYLIYSDGQRKWRVVIH